MKIDEPHTDDLLDDLGELVLIKGRGNHRYTT